MSDNSGSLARLDLERGCGRDEGTLKVACPIGRERWRLWKDLGCLRREEWLEERRFFKEWRASRQSCLEGFKFWV